MAYFFFFFFSPLSLHPRFLSHSWASLGCLVLVEAPPHTPDRTVSLETAIPVRLLAPWSCFSSCKDRVRFGSSVCESIVAITLVVVIHRLLPPPIPLSTLLPAIVGPEDADRDFRTCANLTNCYDPCTAGEASVGTCDACGVCAGDNSTCLGCDGVPGSHASVGG